MALPGEDGIKQMAITERNRERGKESLKAPGQGAECYQVDSPPFDLTDLASVLLFKG